MSEKKLADKKIYLRVIKIVVILLAVLLVAFILLKVAFGDDKNITFSDEYLNISSPEIPVKTLNSEDETTNLIAENDVFKLEYVPKTDLILLTEKESGMVHRSYPEMAEGELSGDGVTLSSPIFRLTSPVIICYTQNGQNDEGEIGINQVSHEKTVNTIENGLQLVYNLPQFQMSFTMEFTIDNEGFQVKIPRNSISDMKDGSEARILSLAPLPYFLAARDGEEGYYVLPDGSGALTYFDVPRLTSFSIYDKRVYGYDAPFDNLDSPNYAYRSLTMPATGKVQGHSMISMFATDSEAGSAITMVNPGKNNVPLYGLAFKFHYRQVYSMTMSKNGEVFDQYEEEIGIGDACVNYYFDNRSEAEEEFTYVDLAVRVREKLQESWIDDFGVENKSSGEDGAIVNLKVFLGAENSTGGLIDTFEVLTSFEQVKEIYETLRGVGVDQIRISLLGWQSDGYFGNICDKFPAESALGGDEDLKKLLAWAGENNIEMALEYNSLLMYGSPTSGITLREAVVKSPATTYQEFNLTFPSGVWRSWDPFYYMSPLFYEREMLDDDIARLKEYGLNSLDVLTVGTELFSDYNKANALTRQQSMHHYVNWMKKYKENFDNVSVYYGPDYAVALADRVLDIPTTTSSLQILDEQVPFLQIVYHGLVDYYASPLNRADNEQTEFLRAIEYGAMLSYELTYNSTEEMKYTLYNTLFRSKYDLLADGIAEQYAQSSELLKNIKNAVITGHYRVADDVEVFCTEYSNGTKVYVNYESAAYTVEDGITVDALSFVYITA